MITCDVTGEDNCDNRTNTMTTISGLWTADTSDTRVRVRAQDAGEGASPWSRTVTVKTNKADNNAPDI